MFSLVGMICLFLARLGPNTSQLPSIFSSCWTKQINEKWELGWVEAEGFKWNYHNDVKIEVVFFFFFPQRQSSPLLPVIPQSQWCHSWASSSRRCIMPWSKPAPTPHLSCLLAWSARRENTLSALRTERCEQLCFFGFSSLLSSGGGRCSATQMPSRGMSWCLERKFKTNRLL